MDPLFVTSVVVGMLLSAGPPTLLARRRAKPRLALAVLVAGIATPGLLAAYVAFGVDGYYDQLAIFVVGFPLVAGGACVVLLRIVSAVVPRETL
jgi:hypothetical protein